MSHHLPSLFFASGLKIDKLAAFEEALEQLRYKERALN
jgi:hypothetical protein